MELDQPLHQHLLDLTALTEFQTRELPDKVGRIMVSLVDAE